MERPVRIELTALAWKARVLPLYDGRTLENTGGGGRIRTYEGDAS
jgi:hypothetical protein